MMVGVIGSVTITLTSLAQSNGGATGAFTNMITGLGAFTANEYQLLYGVTPVAGSNTVSIGFSSSPVNAPKFWYLECIPAPRPGGLFFEDLNGSSPFDTANAVAGSSITLFNPGAQYRSHGEMFVCMMDTNVSVNSVSPAGYSLSNVAGVGAYIESADYNNGIAAATLTMASSGNVMGVGTVLKYVMPYIPTCQSALGVM
jgi:hypothetical protein